jgi:hypothetical protein
VSVNSLLICSYLLGRALGSGKPSDATDHPDFSSIFGFFLDPSARPRSIAFFIIFSSASILGKLTISSHLGRMHRSFAAQLRLDSV